MAQANISSTEFNINPETAALFQESILKTSAVGQAYNSAALTIGGLQTYIPTSFEAKFADEGSTKEASGSGKTVLLEARPLYTLTAVSKQILDPVWNTNAASTAVLIQSKAQTALAQAFDAAVFNGSFKNGYNLTSENGNLITSKRAELVTGLATALDYLGSNGYSPNAIITTAKGYNALKYAETGFGTLTNLMSEINTYRSPSNSLPADIILIDSTEGYIGQGSKLDVLMSEDGVITDESGNVTYNAVTHNGYIFRIEGLYGFATPDDTSAVGITLDLTA